MPTSPLVVRQTSSTEAGAGSIMPLLTLMQRGHIWGHLEPT